MAVGGARWVQPRGAASIGVPRLTVAKILNHAEQGVTAVYDRHSYDREKREALDAWAKRLAEIVGTAKEGGDNAASEAMGSAVAVGVAPRRPGRKGRTRSAAPCTTLRSSGRLTDATPMSCGQGRGSPCTVGPLHTGGDVDPLARLVPHRLGVYT